MGLAGGLASLYSRCAALWAPVMAHSHPMRSHYIHTTLQEHVLALKQLVHGSYVIKHAAVTLTLIFKFGLFNHHNGVFLKTLEKYIKDSMLGKKTQDLYSIEHLFVWRVQYVSRPHSLGGPSGP